MAIKYDNVSFNEEVIKKYNKLKDFINSKKHIFVNNPNRESMLEDVYYMVHTKKKKSVDIDDIETDIIE